ncbi:MAG: GPW/gp25 family protein [Bacteroidales bacterium]|nr:GPW/gp25 family protein [Bacteroidales bacterium]
MDLQLPLRIHKGNFVRSRTEDESVRDNIELIITTPLGEMVTDPQFGFVLNNMRFESFDETSGTIRGSVDEERGWDYLYSIKVSGSSKNIDTFANVLKNAIVTYENRIKDVEVSMIYQRLEQKIDIEIKGKRCIDDSDFVYKTVMRTWK